ncbi:SapB/AmfS family lanthipeptide [Nocardiopsis rhodophaea]
MSYILDLQSMDTPVNESADQAYSVSYLSLLVC